jgi:phosphoglycerol transferase MdoB-like AlkP superfamily enzyme
MPSINGTFASHCSAMPPSRHYVTALTHVRFLCLPDILRRRGYRTELFNAADTDWDNSRHWFRGWYERMWRPPAGMRDDRIAFRRYAERLKALGRSGRPFFAAIMSVTNHTPFTSPEPALNVAGTGSAAERIRNTTRYTDAAVQDLLEALRGEPWLERTLIVITGDHGFNVGEHGEVSGQHNLFRESVWVPLVIIGPHTRLPSGRHGEAATLLDLPPTLADLLGLRFANPWQGHSLLAVNGRGETAFGFRDSLLAETAEWSAVRDPGDGRIRLYRRSDWLQQNDVAAERPALARMLIARAERARRLNDYLLRNDRIWRSGELRAVATTRS